ncbi:accessory gene regulator ArgB-like protein [Clostridium sp.]|uniref:accessory gene regulator ArgB-like protein n=1 Tax=Clostridium sp. TaxID=1506 RepID=UPI002634D231|nr:accessory gene regulator B family protein [Clostridium sp.]
MISIEKIANKIAIFLADNMDDYINISEIRAKRRHKEYELLNRKEAISFMQFGIEGILGDFVKTLIILLIGIPLKILIPSIFIMITFCTLRPLSGGVHMGNYTKCLSLGSVLFLGFAWLIQNYSKYIYIDLINVIYGFIILILVLIVGIFAPVDCPNKPILELDKPKFKMLSMIQILIVGVILSIIPDKYYIIKISMITGLILQVFNITPFGIKFFNNIECIVDKIFSVLKNLLKRKEMI